MPPNVIVCRHCKQAVVPADLYSEKHKTKGFGWGDSRHAIAVLEEGGPLDGNLKRTVIRRRVLVCLVGLTRWH